MGRGGPCPGPATSLMSSCPRWCGPQPALDGRKGRLEVQLSRVGQGRAANVREGGGSQSYLELWVACQQVLHHLQALRCHARVAIVAAEKHLSELLGEFRRYDELDILQRHVTDTQPLIHTCSRLCPGALGSGRREVQVSLCCCNVQDQERSDLLIAESERRESLIWKGGGAPGGTGRCSWWIAPSAGSLSPKARRCWRNPPWRCRWVAPGPGRQNGRAPSSPRLVFCCWVPVAAPSEGPGPQCLAMPFAPLQRFESVVPPLSCLPAAASRLRLFVFLSAGAVRASTST